MWPFKSDEKRAKELQEDLELGRVGKTWSTLELRELIREEIAKALCELNDKRI